MDDFSELQTWVTKFGLSDDVERSQAISSASKQELADLIAAVADHEDKLDAYFAQPNVDSMSAEYIGLTATRLAAEEADSLGTRVSQDLRKQRSDEILNSIFGRNK